MRFPEKLWNIVNKCTSDAIKWSPNGERIVMDYSKFQEEVLDKDEGTFKTSKMDSFIRQLNLYGFRKCNRYDERFHEFQHPYFLRGKKNLIERIRRDSTSNSNKRLYRGSRRRLFTSTRQVSTDVGFNSPSNEMLEGGSRVRSMQGNRLIDEESWWKHYQLYNARLMQNRRNRSFLPEMMPIDWNPYAALRGSAHFPQMMIPKRKECNESIKGPDSSLESNAREHENVSCRKGVPGFLQTIVEENESFPTQDKIQNLSNGVFPKIEQIESTQSRFLHNVLPKENESSFCGISSSSLNMKETLSLKSYRKIEGMLPGTSQKELSASCNKSSTIIHGITPKNTEISAVKVESTLLSPLNSNTEKENLNISQSNSTECHSGRARAATDSDSGNSISSSHWNDTYANPGYFFMPTPSIGFYPGFLNGSRIPVPYYVAAEAEMREYYNCCIPGNLG